MAFAASGLSLLGGANGFNHWHYRTSDPMTTVIAVGYWSGDAPEMLGSKDIISIEANGSTGLFAVGTNGVDGVSLERIADDWVHDPDKIYLANFTPQTELLAGTSRFIVTPVAGWVSRMTTIVRSAVTTGGTLTVELATVAVPGLSNVIPNAAAAGDVVTDTPRYVRHDGAYVAARTAIELVGDAAFATAGDIIQIIEIDPEDPSDGTVYLSHFINQVDLLAATSQFLVAPVAGQIQRLTTVTSDDVTTGGNVTVELATVAVTGLTVVVANAGGAGDVDTDIPTSEADATGTVVAGDDIEIVLDAAFATAGSLFIVLEIDPTVDDDVCYAFDYIEQVDLLAGTSHWVAAPVSGRIERVRTVSTVDITTGGVVTIELGGVAIPGLSVVVADAGGVGDADTDAPGTDVGDLNLVEKGDPIEIIPSAAFATAGTLGVLIEITPG